MLALIMNLIKERQYCRRGKMSPPAYARGGDERVAAKAIFACEKRVMAGGPFNHVLGVIAEVLPAITTIPAAAKFVVVFVAIGGRIGGIP
jgi:hypothetical protein